MPVGCQEDQDGGEVVRYRIVLEQVDEGFAVQVPDLAIATFGESIESAKTAAAEAIVSNLGAHHDLGMAVPGEQAAVTHLGNPDFRDLLFADVDVIEPHETIAA